MNYCGIDLHSNNCVVIVSDENDRIVYQKRLSNELAQIAAALEPYRRELAGVVVESTYNWYWLVDGLMDSGYRYTWPIPLPSGNTMDLNTAEISPMRPIWRSC